MEEQAGRLAEAGEAIRRLLDPAHHHLITSTDVQRAAELLRKGLTFCVEYVPAQLIDPLGASQMTDAEWYQMAHSYSGGTTDVMQRTDAFSEEKEHIVLKSLGK